MRPRYIMATLAIVALVAAALLLDATSTQSQSAAGGSPPVLLGATDVAAAGDFDGDKRVDLVVAAHHGFSRRLTPSPRGAAVVRGARLTPRGLLAQRSCRSTVHSQTTPRSRSAALRQQATSTATGLTTSC